MVDLAGYTALTETHGDEHAADLAVQFAGLARHALGDEDRLVKPIGDAVLLASPAPETGIELVARLLRACSELDGFPLARAGLHHGPAAERDGDMFGTAVNLAARIAGQAAGGQVLATTEIAHAARRRGTTTTSIGPVELRNLTTPIELFEIDLGLERPAGSIDPVCRMWIDHARASGRLQHSDHTYWFCSLACVARFSQDPDAFAAR
jgi:class 3 adenylate cyclase